MSEDTTIPAPPDHCEQCGTEYVNVMHPLKPGVIMQRLCKCEIVVQNIPGGSVTMLVPPKKDE